VAVLLFCCGDAIAVELVRERLEDPLSGPTKALASWLTVEPISVAAGGRLLVDRGFTVLASDEEVVDDPPSVLLKGVDIVLLELPTA
jgi:hypothetical protein